ncbi:hypothetical protein [Flavitalea sp.]|nr:hypothetical protein [Flavitalea sp.]
MKLAFPDTKTIGEVSDLKLLNRFGEVTYYDTTTGKETFNRVKDADIVITNKVVIDKGIIDGTTKLKLICVAATGTNNIDIQAADDRGIAVKNVADYSTSVAQATFALLFQLVNKISK